MDYGVLGESRTKRLMSCRAESVLPVILIFIIVIGFAYYEYSYESNIQDYISDETWYVSSARNILRTYFGLVPSGLWDGMVRVTIQLEYPSTSSQYSAWAKEAEEYVESLGGRLVKGVNYYTFKSGGDFFPAICVDIPPENLSQINSTPHMDKYAVGYCYPHAKGILDYMNHEHPPLVKYLIGLVMVTIGDYPQFWRIPSLIAGSAILVLIFMAFRKILGPCKGGFLGVAAALITTFDITFRSLSMVALLDIFVALFTFLTYYFTLTQRLTLTSISLGLGFVSKFSGGFAGVPSLIEWIRKEKPAKVLLYIIYIPIIILIIASLPFIIKDGFVHWWGTSIEGAFRWHLSVKTTGGPPQALPWDWLLGKNPFPLHYVCDETGCVADLSAAGNPVLYMITVCLSIFLIPVVRKLPDKGVTYLFTWGTFLMYVLIYFLGSKTQYSFYAVQVVPLFYTLLILQIYYLAVPPARAMEVAKKWINIFKSLFDWLAGYVDIKIKIIVSPKAVKSAEAPKEGSVSNNKPVNGEENNAAVNE